MLGVLVLGETLDAAELVGAVLVISGVVLANAASDVGGCSGGRPPGRAETVVASARLGRSRGSA